MTPEWTIDIPEAIPSKKNSYGIRFNRSFWRAISGIAGKMGAYVKGPLYWIGPSQAVKDAELAIAWRVKAAIRKPIDTGYAEVTVRLFGRPDLDNTLGVIFDGIEQSGMIENDRLIKRLVVEWPDDKGKGAQVTIRPLVLETIQLARM